MYDCIIIGTGPAGLSAALNMKTFRRDFLWFGTENLSLKITKAEKITNYPGFPEASGADLFSAFDEHRRNAGLEITEKTVTNIGGSGGHFMVLAENDIYESKTVILCMGVMNTRLLEREEELLGRGLSYCATCDGMLYKGKKIAVICNDSRFEHEVEYLAQLADEVYYLPAFSGSKVSGANLKLIEEKPVGLRGERRVDALLLESGEALSVDGVFALRNAIAPSKLMPGLEVSEGHIVISRSCETNIPGCFAAGDCTGRPYQYTKAVGEGNVAAHSCVKYLALLDK